MFENNNGVDFELVPFASGDASELVLRSVDVGVIVSDWLWVFRMRSVSSPVSR